MLTRFKIFIWVFAILLSMLHVGKSWGQDVCVASPPIKPSQVCSTTVVYSVNGTPGCNGGAPTSPLEACGQVCSGYNGYRVSSANVCSCFDALGNPTGGGPITSATCTECTEPFCDPGDAFIDNKCMRKSALEFDTKIAEGGGVVLRDDNGNILSVQNPVGTTIESQGGHDAFGRPAWIDDINYQWDATGGVLPTAIGIGGENAYLHWANPATPNAVYANGVSSLLTYWPNGSLATEVDRAPGLPLSRHDWTDKGISLMPKPKSAPAQPLNMHPHVGVHQITLQPGGNLYQIPVIAAGATLLYPPVSAGLARFVKETWNNCFPAVLDNDTGDDEPKELAKFCTAEYFVDRAMCNDLVNLKYKGRPRNDPAIINAAARDLMDCVASAASRYSLCLLRIPQEQWPPLQVP